MLAGILEFSVRRRGVVVLLAAAAAAFGVVALRDLPIDAVPDVTSNQVQVNAVAPALSPVDVEKQVTFPIETALAGIPGLESTRSLSRNGFAQVTAVFADHVDPWFARTQVNERLSEARDLLPLGVEPRMGAISTGLGEIYMWAVEFEHPDGRGAEVTDGKPGWQSDGSYLTPERQRLATPLERAAYLRTVQDWIIRPQLKGVAGVAGIDAIGGFVKQYHVAPDPMALTSYGLGFADVIDALERNNVSTGAGFVEHAGESWLVRVSGRIETLAEIGRVVIGNRGGTPIRVSDVAEVGVGRELRTGSAGVNGEEVVIGTALMLIGANSRTVAAAVDARMDGVRRSLPADVRARTLLDRTKLVNATISTVVKNLAEGAGLVVLVLFVLLGHLRAALLVALSIPLSMAITAIAMTRAHVSGNLMSLGAIDFGLIVDGAVIVVENCLRRLAARSHALGRSLDLEERLREVAAAAREMIGPSVFGQAIIITVYVPILALTGVEGKMFHPMALTVIFALGAAFVLSLTLVPALVALVVRGRVKHGDNAIVRTANAVYAPVLRLALRARFVVVLLAIAAFVSSLALFSRLGQEFVPTLDEQDVAIHALRIPSTGITQSTSMQHDVERAIAKLPEVSFSFSKTGTAEMASDPMPPNASDTYAILKPRAQWPDPRLSKAELIERMEAALSDLPGNAFEFTQPIQMRFNELIAGVRADLAIKVFGDDVPAMTRAASRIAAVLESIRGAADVKVEQTDGMPVLNVDVDRAATARLGVDVADVEDLVATAIGGRTAGQVFEGDRRFDLVVRLPEALRNDLDAIERLPVALPDGAEHRVDELRPIGHDDGDAAPSVGFVPLASVARVGVTEGQNQVSRENGKRRVVVQANVRDRDLGSFVGEVIERVKTVRLPAGSWLEYGGQFENLIAARERLAVVVPICFVLIFLLLIGALGSARTAAFVFSGVPLGLSGGIVALWARGIPFSISAGVGFIALSGVAVLNGLVMVTCIDRLRGEGASLDAAIRDGCRMRLRPVLTTALVASLGFLPMALATGTGAEVQRPLATVVIGGLVSSTLLTLVVLPALYRMFARRTGAGTEPNSELEPRERVSAPGA